MIQGIDVSMWQGNIDWGKAGGAARFAWIKLSEGLSIDTRGDCNWQFSKGKLPRGGYHYFHPNVDGTSQARVFVSRMSNDFGELPPAIDIEEPTTQWTDTWKGNLRACLQTVQDMTSRLPVIYTGAWFMPYVRPADWLARYPLWLAAYTSTTDIQVPAPWTTYAVHQYSATGNAALYGCSGTSVDVNRFNGDEAAFASFCNRAVDTTNVLTINGVSMTLPITIQ